MNDFTSVFIVLIIGGFLAAFLSGGLATLAVTDPAPPPRRRKE
jgi:hypothetical protein